MTTTTRRGKPWSAKEEASLTRRILHHGATCTLDELAAKHERTSVAVLLRIRKLLHAVHTSENMSIDQQLNLMRQQFPKANMTLIEQALRMPDRAPASSESGATTTSNGSERQCTCAARLLALERRTRALEDAIRERGFPAHTSS
ncbi:hypothetical protein EBZ80_18380 [bacterium]|nr:hypothetical protein [bacterium]